MTPQHASGFGSVADVYVGGFDCNFFPARDTAWVFRAPIETVLGSDP